MDHQILGTAGGQMEVVLVAAKKEVISDYSMAIREAKLQPTVLDVTAFTIQNAFEVNYTLEPGETVALINIGATMATINILSDGHQRLHPRRGRRGQRVHRGDPEAPQRQPGRGRGLEAGRHHRGEVLPHEVEGVIAEVAEAMAGKLQRSLDFFLSSTADAKLARIYLCGGTAKVPALQRALEQKSRTPVEILDPFRRIIIEKASSTPPSCSNTRPRRQWRWAWRCGTRGTSRDSHKPAAQQARRGGRTSVIASCWPWPPACWCGMGGHRGRARPRPPAPWPPSSRRTPGCRRRSTRSRRSWATTTRSRPSARSCSSSARASSSWRRDAPARCTCCASCRRC